MLRQLPRLVSYAVLASVVSCHEKDDPPSIVGTWVFYEKELSSCSDPSMNKIEKCSTGCYSYRFGSLGFYTIYSGAGASQQTGSYRVDGNRLIFSNGDYEIILTDNTLEMIQRNWPVYNGTTYVYCTQSERYFR